MKVFFCKTKVLLPEFVFIVFFIILFSFPIFVKGQDYIPLSPLPGVTQEQLDSEDPGGFFNQLFIITVGAAALLAVLMLAIGGLQYMGTDAWSTKQDAKDRIKFAVLGLLILLFAWLLLYTINPDLIKLKFFKDIKESLAPKN